MRERGMRIEGIAGLWTQSESFDGADRRSIEAAWEARIYDLYGMQEKCVLMTERERGRLHVRSEVGLVELVPATDSELSEVVATGFFNAAMPFLRYRTRDLAEPEAAPCPCGRELPTVKRVVGRVEDRLYASDGRQIFEVDSAIADLPHIRSCQSVQERLQSIRVRVVPTSAFSDSDVRTLCERLRRLLGSDMDIDVERCEAIPRTATGKQRFVVSRIHPPRAAVTTARDEPEQVVRNASPPLARRLVVAGRGIVATAPVACSASITLPPWRGPSALGYATSARRPTPSWGGARTSGSMARSAPYRASAWRPTSRTAITERVGGRRQARRPDEPAARRRPHPTPASRRATVRHARASSPRLAPAGGGWGSQTWGYSHH
jgi:hypothetical protein